MIYTSQIGHLGAVSAVTSSFKDSGCEGCYIHLIASAEPLAFLYLSLVSVHIPSPDAPLPLLSRSLPTTCVHIMRGSSGPVRAPKPDRHGSPFVYHPLERSVAQAACVSGRNTDAEIGPLAHWRSRWPHLHQPHTGVRNNGTEPGQKPSLRGNTTRSRHDDCNHTSAPNTDAA